MKLLIASDIHGSSYYTKLLFDRIEEFKPDRILLLGDLLYHGPRNALPQEYDTSVVLNLLNSVSNKILAVRGNCDSEVDQMVLNFPMMSDTSAIYAEGNLIFMSHGHRYNPQNLPPVGTGNVLLFGHTHVPTIDCVDGVLCLNPGSVSIPKGGSVNSYLTYDKGVFSWRDVTSGATYKTYTL